MTSGINTATVFLRRAEDLDGPAVKALVFQVLEEYGLKPEPNGMDADLDALHAVYMEPGGVFEVLENASGKIIGCYGLFVVDEQCCELRKMYLHADTRGRGFGKALLCRALSVAKRLGFSEMQLETASCLKEAIGLYVDFGFESLQGKHEVERCDLAFRYNLSRWDEQRTHSNEIPVLNIRDAEQ
ncbi:MAG: GNAT family N-acetyltransferase [Gammaproteobacteria bacterium]